MEGLSHGRWEARPGNYAPAADRVATDLANYATMPCVRGRPFM
jgi:hypothetical protein